jgi:hypothetical protein
MPRDLLARKLPRPAIVENGEAPTSNWRARSDKKKGRGD